MFNVWIKKQRTDWICMIWGCVNKILMLNRGSLSTLVIYLAPMLITKCGVVSTLFHTQCLLDNRNVRSDLFDSCYACRVLWTTDN